MGVPPSPIEIFCSYAHEDEAWLRKLETHLSLLRRQGLISLWHDRLIIPGADWTKSLDTHLETASVILLLVSANFLASDYCYGVEMKRALEREAAGEARVVPILVRPMDWTGAPFAHLQALPTDAKPITSWRNKETALADVAAGLRRVIEELPLLPASPSRAALPTFWNVPYPRNLFFLGHEHELAQLHDSLQAGQATALSQPQAISGLGGIGKTQLALEYAYRYHQDYQVVLWAHAESAEALVSSYVAIASLLQLPEHEAKEQEITVQAVKAWLQTHRGWLLILDNADELAVLPAFLPSLMAGHLLLTTRASATGRLAHRLEIETLAPEQGALFLLRRAGLLAPDATLEQTSSQERELATQISQELGGLPLALDQAGAYLEETGMNLGAYRQIYQQHRADLFKRRGGLVADHPEPVATTWSLSFQKLQEQQPAAADLLQLCAYLAPDAIAEEILTEGAAFLGPILEPVATDAFLLGQTIEALRAYSLVRRDPGRKALSVHRLVQAVLQDQLEEAERRSWVERAMLAINSAFPASKYETWPQCERLLPHALLVAQWSGLYQISRAEVGRLLAATASYLEDRARYHEAEPLFQRALRIHEQQLGPEHPYVATSFTKLAGLYDRQGKYAEAESLYQRALATFERQLGPEHPNVAASLNNLAGLYDRQGKYAEAEPLYQRALRIWERQLGPEHPNVASLLNNLASLYRGQGRYAEAEPLLQRALRINEQQLGPEHPNVAYPLNNLAGLYREQGKYAEAEPLYQRALRINEQQLLGPEHPDVAYPLNNLGDLYREQGRYAEAEPLLQRALRINEQQLGPEHPNVAESLTNLAVLYDRQGKYAEAEPLFQRALRIWERQLGPEHPNVAASLNNLGEFYREQGRYAEAESLYQRALATFERQLGPEHPNVAASLNNLGEFYREQGRYAEAESLYQRALATFERQLGPEHPDAAYPLNGLGNLYREQGRYAEAELLYQRALHNREHMLGSQHPEIAETMHDVAQFWEKQGNSEEARAWYSHALAIRKQVLGAHHPQTAKTCAGLIALLHRMGQHEEAAKLEATQAEI